MKFWDSSAIVPILVLEAASKAAVAALNADPDVIAWWGTTTECASALARRERDGDVTAEGTSAALSRLDGLRTAWAEVQPVDRVRSTAVRLLRTHPLRAADALQLAAAIAAAEDHPETLPFVTLDEHLAEAASREGFRVMMPGSARTS
jgi:predicted nucleic acid-binding protein